MKAMNYVMSSLILIFLSCKQENQTIKKFVYQDYINDLTGLNNKDLTYIDSAVVIFKTYKDRAKSSNQVDSLFLPFFTFYNNGRTLDTFENDELAEYYGFEIRQKKTKKLLIPTKSSYLQKHLIKYFSKPMQEFCNQQLQEFEINTSLENLAKNTLWWEDFNKDYPNFFLKDMSVYHYKNWHLKNLLNGTKTMEVYNKDSILTNQAKSVYKDIIDTYPSYETADILKKYLIILNSTDFKKTNEVSQFINTFK